MFFWVEIFFFFFGLGWLCYIFGLIWYFGVLGFDHDFVLELKFFGFFVCLFPKKIFGFASLFIGE